MEKKIKSNLEVPFGIAGASIGMGIIGKAFDSVPLQEAGATAAKFVAPAVNIAAGGLVIGMLKDLKEVKKKK